MKNVCFLCFLFSCVPHDLENPERKEDAPPGGASWKKIPDQDDGHYNVTYKMTGNTCGGQYVQTSFHGVWDFISKDKDGIIMFDNNFFWLDLPVELDEDGNFKKEFTDRPFPFFTGFFALGIKINGQIRGNILRAEITEIVLRGPTPEVKPVCHIDYKAEGYKRYQPKTQPAKTLAGEYKSRIKTASGTCEFRNFYNNFGIVVLPQNSGYNVKISWLEIAGLALKDGIADIFIQKSDTAYILRGKITPELLDLRLTIDYGKEVNCFEDYIIYGEKRFEEADGKDATTDGLYIGEMLPQEASCEMENFTKETRLIDSVKTSGRKAIFTIGDKTFAAEIGANGDFSAVMEDDYYKTSSTFSGNINTKSIKGTVTTIVTWPGAPQCFYSYKVTGQKLYKHN